MSIQVLKIKKIVPNENWQLVIEFIGFIGLEYRTLDYKILHSLSGWSKIAFPQYFKEFSILEHSVIWPGCGEVSTLFLYENSIQVERDDLKNHYIRLGFQNRAPTKHHNHHHVYGGLFLHIAKSLS